MSYIHPITLWIIEEHRRLELERDARHAKAVRAARASREHQARPRSRGLLAVLNRLLRPDAERPPHPLHPRSARARTVPRE